MKLDNGSISAPPCVKMSWSGGLLNFQFPEFGAVSVTVKSLDSEKELCIHRVAGVASMTLHAGPVKMPGSSKIDARFKRKGPGSSKIDARFKRKGADWNF